MSCLHWEKVGWEGDAASFTHLSYRGLVKCLKFDLWFTGSLRPSTLHMPPPQNLFPSLFPISLEIHSALLLEILDFCGPFCVYGAMNLLLEFFCAQTCSTWTVVIEETLFKNKLLWYVGHDTVCEKNLKGHQIVFPSPHNSIQSFAPLGFQLTPLLFKKLYFHPFLANRTWIQNVREPARIPNSSADHVFRKLLEGLFFTEKEIQLGFSRLENKFLRRRIEFILP